MTAFVMAAGLVVALTVPALAQPAHVAVAATQRADHGQGSGQNDGTQLANLPAVPATESCATLAQTTMAGGQDVQVAAEQTASATTGGPEYCALTGTINTYIGFEILLPLSTWRQRYLQIGCGGLCGNIGLSAPETTGYAPLADGYFVVASQDEGHSGQGTDWYSNPEQRVDFAYLSDHLLAEVAKGLASQFYGMGPRYSYFDGCSQGGHQALTEVQRFPKDFNGVLAGAPASIMTELNSVLHEYEYDTVLNSSGTAILSEQQAELVGNAAMQACYPQVGLMLDYRNCAEKFDIYSLECSATLTTNCLTAAQIAAMEAVYNGPVDPQGQHLYPGGYPLGSEFNWDNPTSVNVPPELGEPVIPATFITAWLQYFAFETDIGTQGVADEPFTAAYFEKIEKLAPFWDATNPDLSAFERDGGKLILWQGEADWSIPTISSIAYYQAVVRAMGGIGATQQFARYYLLPSVGHCGGNGPDTYNGLGAVVQWTELHQAPAGLVASEYSSPLGGGGTAPGAPSTLSTTSDLTDAVPVLGAAATSAPVRSITLFPYPELPAYNGYGDVDVASSFYGQVSAAVQQPTPWLGRFDSVTMWCNAEGVDCYETGYWPPDGHKA
ncbi:MAG TPA: tannase/feruloyl esterase family alpha/beta hydrolase [Streptosporangiaceae bacterium]|nr:tannase/feruloyl esterase family alpha/beta hydrolase [Streptosporangiaceae bacterium]